MNPHLLHYDALASFNEQFYKDLLTMQNVTTGMIEHTNLKLEDGDEQGRFWGWELEKNGIKYLLPSRIDGQEIVLKDLLPIRAKYTLNVSSKGVVYKFIEKPVSAKFRPRRTMSFKNLVDKFSIYQHTNSKHQKLLWFIGLCQTLDRANFRVCSPPGFGKDSVVDTFGNLIGNTATIESPTLAKLEFMSTYKWLAVNEVVGIAPGEWRIIEQYLLATGAHKPKVTKHSRAFGGAKEELNISQHSLSIFYNDIDCYHNMDKYVDFVTKDAVLDRFPALRLNGVLTEDFNAIKAVNIHQLVKNNIEAYKEIIENFEYYRTTYPTAKHNYEVKGLPQMPSRWVINLHRLFNIIDMYCESQEEFDEWVQVVVTAMDDYKAMLQYRTLINKVTDKLSNEQFTTLFEQLKGESTFINKNKRIQDVLEQGKVVNVVDKNIWDSY